MSDKEEKVITKFNLIIEYLEGIQDREMEKIGQSDLDNELINDLERVINSIHIYLLELEDNQYS